MATKVTDESTVTTQDGTKLVVKPLTITALRKFMTVIDKMNDMQEEQNRAFRKFQRDVERYNKLLQRYLDDETGEVEEPEEPKAPRFDQVAQVEVMTEAALIALEKHNTEFVKDQDAVENELDIEVLKVILKDAGGVDLDGDDSPNQAAPTKGE